MKAIESKLYSTLSGDVTLCNYVGGTAAPRIYNTTAPPEAAYPLVVFHKQGGGHTNDTPRENVEILYAVKCIGPSLSGAEDIDNRCRQLLDGQDLQVGDGYADYATFRGGHLNFAEELSGGSIIYHIGAFYRVMAAGTT